MTDRTYHVWYQVSGSIEVEADDCPTGENLCLAEIPESILNQVTFPGHMELDEISISTAVREQEAGAA